jgi:hypothetical protein
LIEAVLSSNLVKPALSSSVSHAAWPQIKMREDKTARRAQEQQSSAIGALYSVN